MAVEVLKLDAQEREAGGEYLASLRKLGLEPEVLAWAFVDPGSRKELVLISSWVDTVGPKALYDLLFAAYDASATPKAIDPFIVSVYSPKSVFGDQLLHAIEHVRSDYRLPAQRGIFSLDGGEVTVFSDMIYTVGGQSRSNVENLRRFKRFARQVTALAA